MSRRKERRAKAPPENPAADELLRKLIWKRFAEVWAAYPHSMEYHLLHCGSRQLEDFTHKDEFSCCESCPYVAFTAKINCEHLGITWIFGESGTLPHILDDMAELAAE